MFAHAIMQNITGITKEFPGNQDEVIKSGGLMKM
jgi:hypothetical protein